MAATIPYKNLNEREQSLLEAAIDVISEKGYHGSTTAEIAKKAGVAEGTIFKYFKSKKEILQKIVLEIARQIILPLAISRVKNVLAGDYDSFRELARELILERLDFVKKNPKLIKIGLQEIMLHEEIRDMIRQNFLENVWPHFKTNIRKYQKSGELRKIPEHVIMRSILSLFVGYIVGNTILFPVEDSADEKEIEYTLEILFHGIGK